MLEVKLKLCSCLETVHPSGLGLGAAVDLGTDHLDADVSMDDIDTDVGEADMHMGECRRGCGERCCRPLHLYARR